MFTVQKAAGSTLTREAILRGLQSLSDELGKQGVTGEVCLFGGTVMVLAFTVPWRQLPIYQRDETVDEESSR